MSSTTPPGEGKRTLKQNAAIHLYFGLVAKALNEAGLDVRRTLKPEVDIPWSPYMVKELLWKPVQKIYLGKQSTTELNKNSDITELYEIFNRHLSDRFGEFGLEYVPFPSLEILESEIKGRGLADNK